MTYPKNQQMPKITTTLAKIRNAKPCSDGYKKLCRSLGGIHTYGKDTPLRFSQIIESNGLDDALWCLRTVLPEHSKEVRLLMCDFARLVLPIFEQSFLDDDRVRQAIETSRRFACGQATQDELAAASDAAEAATWIAIETVARAAEYAAGAAEAAAWAAAYAARAAEATTRAAEYAVWAAEAATRAAEAATRAVSRTARVARAAGGPGRAVQIGLFIKRFG